MGFSEAEFWKMTPKEFHYMVMKHIEINDSEKGKKNKRKHYIDEVF